MSSLLYGPDGETLAVVVLNSAELGRIGATAALSVLLTLIMLVASAPVWMLTYLLRSPRDLAAARSTGAAHAR